MQALPAYSHALRCFDEEGGSEVEDAAASAIQGEHKGGGPETVSPGLMGQPSGPRLGVTARWVCVAAAAAMRVLLRWGSLSVAHKRHDKTPAPPISIPSSYRYVGAQAWHPTTG